MIQTKIKLFLKPLTMPTINALNAEQFPLKLKSLEEQITSIQYDLLYSTLLQTTEQISEPLSKWLFEIGLYSFIHSFIHSFIQN